VACASNRRALFIFRTREREDEISLPSSNSFLPLFDAEISNLERAVPASLFYPFPKRFGAMKSNFPLALFSVSLFLLVSVFGVAAPVVAANAASPNSSYAACPGSSGPCPMGITDFGRTASGATYSYTAVTFKSSVTFTSLNIGAVTLKGKTVGSGEMSIQLNTVAEHMYRNGVAGFYWTQDVPFVQQEAGGKYLVFALDNIWDFNNGASMKGVSGNLNHDCVKSGVGSPGQWFCQSKTSFTVSLPFTVNMEMLVGKVNGHSAVEFEFGVSGHSLVAFDEVTFPGTAPQFPLYLVGFFHVPLANILLTDAETVLCGPGGGTSVHLNSISASFNEQYQALSGSTFKTIPHAWSEGRDTAETSSGVHMGASGTTGLASSGSDNSVPLW
jgi:hypothetical protein